MRAVGALGALCALSFGFSGCSVSGPDPSSPPGRYSGSLVGHCSVVSTAATRNALIFTGDSQIGIHRPVFQIQEFRGSGDYHVGRLGSLNSVRLVTGGDAGQDSVDGLIQVTAATTEVVRGNLSVHLRDSEGGKGTADLSAEWSCRVDAAPIPTATSAPTRPA